METETRASTDTGNIITIIKKYYVFQYIYCKQIFVLRRDTFVKTVLVFHQFVVVLRRILIIFFIKVILLYNIFEAKI